MTNVNEKAQGLITWLADSAIKGLPPLTSAYDLAAQYRKEGVEFDADARVDDLIAWESAKNFGTGFLTGVGGILTLPFTVPTALAASWVIQARMVGAIALLYGHDLKSAQARTVLALAMLGGGAKEVLKQVGVGLTVSAIRSASVQTLSTVNRAAGQALLSRAARGGAMNLSKAIPIIGGTISGGVDAYMCRMVGRAAKDLYQPVPLHARDEEPASEPTAEQAAVTPLDPAPAL
ncbi:hypothetical protein GC173_07270 [bacterium]|nr:hypothetical protein [bacterium]